MPSGDTGDADVDKDIEDCDAEIHRLQCRVLFIRNQRRRLEEYKSCLGFLKSPIRRLPNEILLRIFDFASPTNEITSKELGSLPALSISQVCFRWRNLATSSSIIWSRLLLNLNEDSSVYHVSLLGEYLFRSSPVVREAPLFIEIAGPGSLLFIRLCAGSLLTTRTVGSISPCGDQRCLKC